MMSPRGREQLRDELLEAALVHVPFDGWSRRSLRAGAADLGFDAGLVRRLFPRGGDGLLSRLEAWADRQMLAQVETAALAAMPLRERIAALIRARLEVLAPHREAMRRAVAARLLPGNALAACADLWRTVDLIWLTAGDRATDASYYSKRSLLLAVWTSTFFFWLEDRSEGAADSWAFLARRIDDVMSIARLRGRFEALFERLGRLAPRRTPS